MAQITRGGRTRLDSPSGKQTWEAGPRETETAPSLAPDTDPKSWNEMEGELSTAPLQPGIPAAQRRQTYLC